MRFFTGDGCRNCRNTSYGRYSKLKEGETFELTILQTNDFHGHLDDIVTLDDGTVHHNSIANYATIIEDVRNEEENVLLTDGGDVFLRGEFQAGQGDLETLF